MVRTVSRIVPLLAILGTCKAACRPDEEFKNLTFPKGFLFNVATAAYQSEGAWDVDGKGIHMWDTFTHLKPSRIIDGSNGDDASKSYYKYPEDIDNVNDLNFDLYRFSIMWTRILPDGYRNRVNQKGIDFYSRFIDDLLSKGKQPMVTLYHWDLPQTIQNIGGWLNESIVQIFTDYADLMFSLYGDKVKWWITINEPMNTAAGYGTTSLAPGLNLHGTGDYLAAHHIIKAHASVFRLYERKYRRMQKGRISINLSGLFGIPLRKDSTEDQKAAERNNQFAYGWFGHPIYSREGDYPRVMREYIDRNSALEGRKISRLPRFTQEEIRQIRGSYHYLATNHYTSVLCTTGESGLRPSWERDSGVLRYTDPAWPPTAAFWQRIVPEGMRGLLNWLKIQYDNLPTFITENGCATENVLNDNVRVYYLKSYIGQVNKAIYQDGCHVMGYTVWSLMDDFEWVFGYTYRFGLISVNFSDPNRRRTKRQSAYFMKRLIESNKCSWGS